jgi:hypothetical protein
MVSESSLSSTGTTSDASPLPTSNAGPGILHPRSIATHVAALREIEPPTEVEGHRIGRSLRSIGNGTIHPTLPSPMSSTPPTESFPRPSVINGDQRRPTSDVSRSPRPSPTESFPRPSVINGDQRRPTSDVSRSPRPSPRPSSRGLTNNAGHSPTSMQVLHLSIEWSQHPT